MQLRLLIRGLLRAPAFTLASVATIALAVCLSSTVFAIVDGVLFKPLPYPAVEDLYVLSGAPDADGTRGALSSADVNLLKAAAPDVHMTVFGEVWKVSVPARPQIQLTAQRIDPAFFDVLGRSPLNGGFTPEDFRRPFQPREPIPAIVSHRFWHDYAGGEASAIGAVVELSHSSVRVVGILPEDFVLPSGDEARADLLFAMPSEWLADPNRWARAWYPLVRLRPGQAASEVRARLGAALAAERDGYGPPPRPGRRPYDDARLEPVSGVPGAGERPFFRVAFAGAALLILIACVNVTSLMLARTRGRARELRVHVALGAARRHVGWQVVGEVLLVAICGAAIGLLFARPVLYLALQELPDDVELLTSAGIDWRVTLFAFAAPLAAMLMFCAVPVAQAFRTGPASRMSSGSTTVIRSWGASSLLAFETAIGIMLMLLGTLVLVSFAGLRREDIGFASANVGLVDVIVRTSQDTREQRAAVQDQVLSTVAAVPGVESAALFGGSLLENVYSALQVVPAGADSQAWAVEVPVSADFFDVAGLTLEEGRLPTRDELAEGAAVAVLSRPAAREFWGDAPPLGRMVKSRTHTYTVIGVVKDVRIASQREGRVGEAFTPLAHSGRWYAAYVFRAREPRQTAGRVAAAIRRDVPGVLIERAGPIDAAAAWTVRLQRFQASLFGLAAGAALLLIAVGVAGLTAGSVRRRWREAGIRSALGASGARIVRMLMGDQLRPAIAGLAMGLAGSWWVKDILTRLLYQLEPGDPRVWLAATTAILAVVAFAAWLPARRAAAVDPAMVLRSE